VHNGYHQQYTELANIVWNRVETRFRILLADFLSCWRDGSVRFGCLLPRLPPVGNVQRS